MLDDVRSRSRTEAVVRVAHELDDALAGVIGCLERLPRPAERRAADLLDAVVGELRRAGELVEELHGYARVEEGPRDDVPGGAPVERAASSGARSLTLGRRAARPRLEGVRVLVVDDEPMLRRLIEHALVRVGARPTGVGRATEAMQALRQQGFDAVLLDVCMFSGGAPEVFRAIQAERPRLAAHTLLMSGELSTGSIEVVGRGYGGILYKPFGLAMLLDALERVLPPVLAPAGAGIGCS